MTRHSRKLDIFFGIEHRSRVGERKKDVCNKCNEIIDETTGSTDRAEEFL